MARILLSPISFHGETNRDYVLTMNVLLAACAGVAAAMYLHVGYWAIAISVALLAALELSLLSNATAWFAIVVGTAFSAGIGAAGGLAIAAGLSKMHAVWWTACGLGAVGGGVLSIDAHRRLRRSRVATSDTPGRS